MRANTTIGEMVVSTEIEGKAVDIMLRPSFYALNSIGSIKDIDETITGCFNTIDNYFSKYAILPCLTMIWACMSDSDRHYFYDLFGEYSFDDEKGIDYKDGAIDKFQIIVIANHLVKWGVMGNPKKRPKQSDQKVLFDPSEYVGAAMAHLGLGSEAWNLTMTEFQRAIESKFPSDPKKEPISQSRLDDLVKKSKEAHKKLDPNRMSNQVKLARNRIKR